MKRRIRFFLNESIVDREFDDARTALDVIRVDMGLTGTKEGCREGDCGACMVIVGEAVPEALRPSRPWPGAAVEYRAMTSCMTPIGDLEGRHVITIEGIASRGLTPVMEAILDHNGSQCGFCSPGFVMSISAFLLTEPTIDPLNVTLSLEGNLCRCTGYGALRKAVRALAARYGELPATFEERARFLAAEGILPSSVLEFIASPLPLPSPKIGARGPVLGGGTDAYVREPDPEGHDPLFASALPGFREISISGEGLRIGAAARLQDFFSSDAVNGYAPGIRSYAESVASAPIRARATVAGNVVNASPIGDVTSMLLAMGAVVEIADAEAAARGRAPAKRRVPLERFFLGYKKLDLLPGEVVSAFLVPRRASLFSFEKVSRRERLDIASVNSALALELAEGGSIARARISLGGVAPIPTLAEAAGAGLVGKRPDAAAAIEAAAMAVEIATPIGDVRGSAAYRLRLTDRLVRAHFARLFPTLEEELFR